MSFSSLPSDIHLYLLNYCDNIDKMCLKYTNKFYNKNIKNNSKITSVLLTKNGYLNVLRWARENGCPFDEDICTYAAQNGHLEVLKWLRENNCPWNEYTCANAACNGYLEILKWLRENKCPWDESTIAFAVCNRQLEVLKWARANGCPWNKYNEKRVRELWPNVIFD
jgi:hypothetical protein